MSTIEGDQNSKSRNIYIDFIRGIAIIFVVMGHCIQYGSGANYQANAGFVGNSLFKFIYSFHMPLFIIISGYLFSFTVKKYSLKCIMLNRIERLIVPILSFSVINYLLDIIVNGKSIMAFSIKQLGIQTLDNMWFLWAVFYCSVIVCLINKFLEDKLIFYVFIYIITFIIPDDYGMRYYKWMYLYFVIGYLFGKYRDTISIKYMKNRLDLSPVLTGILLLDCFIFFILLRKYNFDSYIYWSGYCIFNGKGAQYMLKTDIYRTIMGLLGSILILVFGYFALKIFNDSKLKFLIVGISNIGKKSMGIYWISTLLFNHLIQKITSDLGGLNYIIMLAETIIIVGGCYMMAALINKNKLASTFILGGR